MHNLLTYLRNLKNEYRKQRRYTAFRRPLSVQTVLADELVRLKLIKEGDLIVMTIGEAVGQTGHTNTMKIVKVGDHRK